MIFTLPKQKVTQIAVTMTLLLPTLAEAEPGPNYQPMDYGTAGCAVTYGPELGGYDADSMKQYARSQGADGFVLDSTTQLSKLIKAPFPPDCRPPVADNEALYLATGPIYIYDKVDFGFNGCHLAFGELQESTDLDAMFEAARSVNAIGFTMQDSLAYGNVIIGAYPQDCASDPSLSWPLYLARGALANYVEQDFGPGECDIKYGPVINGTNRTAMNVAAVEAGAYGYLFQAPIQRGKLILEPYPKDCTADRYLSWPLFLQE